MGLVDQRCCDRRRQDSLVPVLSWTDNLIYARNLENVLATVHAVEHDRPLPPVFAI